MCQALWMGSEEKKGWTLFHLFLKEFLFSKDGVQGPVDDKTLVNVILQACIRHYSRTEWEKYVFKEKVTFNLNLEFKVELAWERRLF